MNVDELALDVPDVSLHLWDIGLHPPQDFQNQVFGLLRFEWILWERIVSQIVGRLRIQRLHYRVGCPVYFGFRICFHRCYYFGLAGTLLPRNVSRFRRSCNASSFVIAPPFPP